MFKNYATFAGIICISAFNYVNRVYGQILTRSSVVNQDSTIIFTEISTFISSSGKTPFWLKSNQFGIRPSSTPAININGMVQDYRILNPRRNKYWQIGGVVEVAANLSNSTKLLFPQLNVSLQYRNWEFFVGRKKQWVGLADSTIGSGSYSWSTNAMPIPKIQFGTSRFVAVPLTGEWIWFSGFYSEGLFENARPVTSHLKLHQKIFYLRIGKASSRIRLYGGFNHQVQWGGYSPYATNNGKMPNGFKNYLNVVTGRRGDTSTDPNAFDRGNRVGNHLGTIDIGLEIEVPRSTFFFYRQNIYEDGSLYALGNIKDGLNGLRIRKKNCCISGFYVSEAVFEFLYTQSQGGASINSSSNSRGGRGRDNYFNNAQVRDGWSYFDKTIGTPFIPPSSDTDTKWPRYANSFTSNNRVSVFHMGLKGQFRNDFSWYTKFSYSTNKGTYDLPFSFTARQFSAILAMQLQSNILNRTVIGLSFALETGKLYRSSVGANLSVRKNFGKNLRF